MAGDLETTMERDGECNSEKNIKQANSAALEAYDMLSFLSASLRGGKEYSPEEMEGVERIITICRDKVWEAIEKLPCSEEVAMNNAFEGTCEPIQGTAN
jgi:hypothetical protein